MPVMKGPAATTRAATTHAIFFTISRVASIDPRRMPSGRGPAHTSSRIPAFRRNFSSTLIFARLASLPSPSDDL